MSRLNCVVIKFCKMGKLPGLFTMLVLSLSKGAKSNGACPKALPVKFGFAI